MIVYDRYHMQAQFGKDVLGVVRLTEARAHKEKADALRESLSQLHGEERKQVKEEARQERRKYTQVKRARWTLLQNHDTLRESQATNLAEILDAHSDLAICYAMKEEMCELFHLRDVSVAESAWKKWFAAAKESDIPALVRFAELKEKRIDGLIAHAIHPISTGKLEGYNNKIKVAKRLAYGYRDNHFFFTLVRFLSVSFPNFP
jgi:transposase